MRWEDLKAGTRMKPAHAGTKMTAGVEAMVLGQGHASGSHCHLSCAIKKYLGHVNCSDELIIHHCDVAPVGMR
jgi:hypothetical protein